MTVEMLIASSALVLAVGGLAATAYLARIVRTDRRRLREVSRRLKVVERRLAKQQVRTSRLRERLGEVSQRAANALAKSNDDASAREALRLATETAKAMELLLMDVNTMRRDLDAIDGGDAR